MTALILITFFAIALWLVIQWEKQSHREMKKDDIPLDDENSYS